MQAMHKMVMDPVSFAFLSADAQLAAGEPQFASSHGENREKHRLFSGVFRRQCRRGRGQYIRLKRQMMCCPNLVPKINVLSLF